MTTGDGFTAEFRLVRRGYDPVAVEGYLRELQTKWLLRVDQAEADAEILRKELDDAKQREEAIHLMMRAATRTSRPLSES